MTEPPAIQMYPGMYKTVQICKVNGLVLHLSVDIGVCVFPGIDSSYILDVLYWFIFVVIIEFYPIKELSVES